MQEVESHWTSGRSLPETATYAHSQAEAQNEAAAGAQAEQDTLHACFAAMNAALACRQRSLHSAQVCNSATELSGIQ